MARPIDADALQAEMMDMVASGLYGLEDMIDAVIESPTLSPDEVRGVGEWIDYQQGRWVYAQCSECGTVHDVRSNYCPNCGARMKGAEDGTTDNA